MLRIGGEGGQLPPELVGPRMMVQLRDRAAQLVKRLSNKDVNGADGMKVIFEESLIRQVDKHKVDEQSYITRASLYRSQLLGLDSSLTMGEAFFAGHLLDHAHLSRRDKAMVKTTAPFGCGRAPGDECFGGIGLGTGRGAGISPENGTAGQARMASGTPGSRAASRHSFAAECGEGADYEEDPGDEDFEEGDTPPELMVRENEAFAMQYKAKQKIAEVRKLRQYYRKPDNEAKRKALSEQMKVNPCHNCGELGHWSRECPHPKGGGSSSGKPQQVLVARTRAPPSVPSQAVSENREWDLLMSLCCSEATRSRLRAWPLFAVQGPSFASSLRSDRGRGTRCSVVVAGSRLQDHFGHRVYALGGWGAVGQLAGDKVAGGAPVVSGGPGGRNLQVRGRRAASKSFQVVVHWKLAGKPVVFAFNIVEGNCPPLFSRSGCTQLAAVIHCERHVVSSRKLGVKNYGVGQDSGHYTLQGDDCEPDCAWLPDDFSHGRWS